MKYINRIFITAVIILMNFAITVKSQEYKVSGNPISGNNSDVINYDIPGSMSPGKKYIITITMVNTGRTNWTKADNYYLSLFDGLDNKYQTDVWGIRRIELPFEVEPSDKIILTFKVTAPEKEGDYNMLWAMKKDSNFFGEYTNNIVNVSSGNSEKAIEYAGNNSEFIDASIPSEMSAGEKYKVRITMRNTGTEPWLPSSYSGYRFSPVIESSEIVYPEWNSESVYLSGAIDPGQISDIEFYVTAPLNPGKYYLQWIMKKDDNLFGQKTKRTTVNVSRNSSSNADSRTYNALFMEQTVPVSMIFNEFQDVSITMSNTGSKTWIKGDEQLVIIDSKKSLTTLNLWNVGYIQLPHNVDPGKLVTFNFKVKPTETGWQYFQCIMMTEGGTLFGSPSQSVEVIISKR